MNKTLTESDAFLVGQTATLADLACYAYTAHAPEGGISLAPYPAIRAWISRLESFEWFQPMPWTLEDAAHQPQHNSSHRNLDPGSFSPSA
jgi:glutathione S-transferase